MNKIKKTSGGRQVSPGIKGVLLLIVGLALPSLTFGAIAPSLGAESTYAIVSSTFTNSNTSPQTIITGDRCDTTPPVTAPLTTTGTITTGGCDPATGTAQTTALNNVTDGLNTQSCTAISGNLNSVIVGANPAGTFPPGCYSVTGAMDITLSTSITLDGGGDPNAVFIFRSTGALTTGADSSVLLTNSANASNVFWAPAAATTLGAYTTGGIPPVGATFVGNILDAAGITLGHFANLSGRALAFGGTVTTDANTITVPSAPTSATLKVIKHVVNSSGGTSVASAWTLTVASSNGGTGTGSAVGVESPGTTYILQSGKAYGVTESVGPSGYSASSSSDCTIASAVAGTTYTCTITNTDVPATLRIVKQVINAGGGTLSASDFNLYVKLSGITNVSGSPAVGVVTPGRTYTLSTGTYVVSEDSNTLYTRDFTGDCDVNGSITLALNADKTCTVVNTFIRPTLPNGPSATGSNSWRTVPIIGLVKIPTPLALSNGPGAVTYNYVVSNVTGIQALKEISLIDDKCSPTVFVSGDLNLDSKLDPGEKWKYSCATTLATTTINTAVVTGYTDDYYHDSAIATAVATVVVGSTVTPPLINIVKIPSQLTPLPFVGGDITYYYTVTNPGVVSISDVTLTDDKCAPVSGQQGDINHDNLLNPTEIWTYTCASHISNSTKNIATVTGKANDFTATGFAFANVIVSPTPGLPNTGLPPFTGASDSAVLISVSLTLLFLTVFYAGRKTWSI